MGTNPTDFQKSAADGVNSTIFAIDVNEGANIAQMNNALRGMAGVVAPPADFGATAGAVTVDDIAESTLDAGVTVDGLLIKDGAIPSIDSQLDALLPPGIQMAYGGDTAPTGWLLCDGAEVSQATYAALYAVIGDKYGTATGGNFRLPNKTGRVSRGPDVSNVVGATGGADEHTMTIGNLIEHSHTMDSGNSGDGATVTPAIDAVFGQISTDPAGSATPDPIPTLPAYETDNWIIKT